MGPDGEGRDAPPAVLHLIGILDDEEFTVRNAAARALASFGKPAERAIRKAIGEAHVMPRRQMIRVLGAMQSRKARRTLQKMLKDRDEGVRRDAAKALEDPIPL